MLRIEDPVTTYLKDKYATLACQTWHKCSTAALSVELELLIRAQRNEEAFYLTRLRLLVEQLLVQQLANPIGIVPVRCIRSDEFTHYTATELKLLQFACDCFIGILSRKGYPFVVHNEEENVLSDASLPPIRRSVQIIEVCLM